MMVHHQMFASNHHHRNATNSFQAQVAVGVVMPLQKSKTSMSKIPTIQQALITPIHRRRCVTKYC